MSGHIPVEQSFDTTGPVDLTLEVGSGSVHVVATGTTESRLSAEGPGAERLEVHQSGNSLSITQPKGRFFRDDRVQVELTVPTGSRVEVRTGSADVTLDGSFGATKVRSGSGEVRIEHVDGSASISTGSGEIDVAAVTGDLRLKTGSGDVRVGRADSELTVSSGSGDVQVEVAGGEAAIKTGSGDARVGTTRRELSFTTGSGSLSVARAVDGRVLVKAASGDVTIGVPAGLPVWTDINTVTGHVRSDIQGVGEPEEGAARLEVHARTVSGGVHLHPVD